MNSTDFGYTRKEWLEKATLQELVDSCIWQSVMAYTAGCGWTDNSREGLVRVVQEHVRWAIETKAQQPGEQE